MTIIDALKHIGIEPAIFISGMSGAISLLTKNKRMTKSQKFLSILSGGLSANYLAPLAVKLFNMDHDYQFGFAFIVGYSGLEGVKMLINKLYNNSNK